MQDRLRFFPIDSAAEDMARLSVEYLFRYGTFEFKGKKDFTALSHNLKQFRLRIYSAEEMWRECAAQFGFDRARLIQHDLMFKEMIRTFLQTPCDYLGKITGTHILYHQTPKEDAIHILTMQYIEALSKRKDKTRAPTLELEDYIKLYPFCVSSHLALVSLLVKQNCISLLKIALEKEPALARLPIPSAFGSSFLHEACRLLNSQCVELLLRHQADVNRVKDATHHTYSPLYLACVNAHKNPERAIIIIKNLLDHGADPTLISETNTPTLAISPNLFCTEAYAASSGVLQACYQMVIDAAEPFRSLKTR